MVAAVVDACLDAGCGRVIAVVGYRQDLVREALAPFGDRVGFAEQAEQLGTGHAVRCAMPMLADEPDDVPVFVLCGDGPLIRSETLRTLLDRHRQTDASATLASSVIEDPTGYGRIVRDADGRFVRIVEQANATPAELEIHEVNPSYYCFRLGDLRRGLERVETNPVTGEQYITDIPEILLAGGGRVEVIDAVPPEDVLSINTPEQLAVVDSIYRRRMGVAGGGA